ncbi:MAG: hypothetical protein R3F60_17400 [bacterium]
MPVLFPDLLRAAPTPSRVEEAGRAGGRPGAAGGRAGRAGGPGGRRRRGGPGAGRGPEAEPLSAPVELLDASPGR